LRCATLPSPRTRTSPRVRVVLPAPESPTTPRTMGRGMRAGKAIAERASARPIRGCPRRRGHVSICPIMTAPSTRPPEFNLPLSGVAVTAGPDGIGETPFDDGPRAEALEIEGDDPRVALRRTLGMFATGVTIITTRVGEQVHGMTANAFMSVSLEPPLVLISVDRRTRMYGLLHEGMHYGVSVLCDSQAALSDRFAGRTDGPEPRFLVVKDTPLVDGAIAHFV